MNEHLENYYRHLIREEKSRATIEKYLRDTKKFFLYGLTRWNGIGWDPGQVTKEMVLDYKAEIAKKYRPSSVNSMLTALNHYLAYINKAECQVKLLRVQRQIFYDGSRELNRDEYMKLVEAARKQKKERLALLMETVCATGIRISELHYITVEAVGTGMARISCKGKERVILIPDRLRKKLSFYCRDKEIQAGSIFVTRSGNPLDRSNVWREMNSLCKTAGISEEKVFPHNMRHLFASTYYKKQKDIVRLADLMGHSSIETTRIYTKRSCKEYEEQLDEMELIV